MRIKEVKEILNGELIWGEEFLETDLRAGCGCDLMSDVLAFISHDNALLLTGLMTTQVIYVADAVNVKAICFVRGKRPTDEIVALAREKEIALLAVDLPLFEACGKLYKAGFIGCSEYEGKG
jgi:predicted transcriptional regulator